MRSALLNWALGCVLGGLSLTILLTAGCDAGLIAESPRGEAGPGYGVRALPPTPSPLPATPPGLTAPQTPALPWVQRPDLREEIWVIT